MKAIISHDIDHLTAWEHLASDLIIPKFIVRSKIELLTGKISVNEFLSRGGEFFSNKWQNIDELSLFNKQHKVPSSFFIGVKNGLGLSYSFASSSIWIKRLLKEGCEVGVHGIEFEDAGKIKNEYELFKSASGLSSFGIRMHYVRKNESTMLNMSNAGYVYDSSEFAFSNPYRVGAMWEFPFQIMDSWEMEGGKRWQSRNLAQAQEATKKDIEKAFTSGLKYVGIIFHDRYFSKSFRTWMEWYTWLVEYLIENKIEFIDFRHAVGEMNSKA
jgi:hypothetical protein